jgi:enamine deaminase RidA (YjgF/YER057c/UK114 family)
MTTGQVQYIHPGGLHKSPTFSNVNVFTGDMRTVYTGGQAAVDVSGNIVNKGDIKAQAEQVLKNVQIAVEAGPYLSRHPDHDGDQDF